MSLPKMRRSFTLVRVSQALMTDPFGIHWGYNIAQSTGLLTGSVYPTLHRMEKVEWIAAEWETPPDGGLHRPPRRVYQITPAGRKALKALLRDAANDTRYAVMFL